MTKKQTRIWLLRQKGYTVREIAKVTNTRLWNVAQTVKLLESRVVDGVYMEPRLRPVSCRHSPSCFSCPRDDCHIHDSEALHTNRLWYDVEADYD